MSKSSTATKAEIIDGVEIIARLPPMHPGEMLREEFMSPHGLTAGKIARACGVPRTRIERIVREELGITGDTALRLGQFFGTSAEFWMNLQCRYELLSAKKRAAKALKAIRRFTPEAA